VLADGLSIAARTLCLALLLQAAGASLFVGLFAAQLQAAADRIWLLAGRAALLGVLALGIHLSVDAARLGGELGAFLDPQMQGLAWSSSSAVAHGTQAAGMLLVVAGVLWSPRQRTLACVGAVVCAGGFALTGHTSVGALRWALGPLLALHTLIAALWFGSLLPLLTVLRRERPDMALAVLRRFSGIATLLVPLIAIAGLLLALGISGGPPSLREGYGRMLLAKAGLFAMLLCLAGLNKWVLLPRLQQQAKATNPALRRSLLAECALILVVLLTTAVLTALFSPGE
jgi:copper transport protein